jgi:hypothetical protein
MATLREQVLLAAFGKLQTLSSIQSSHVFRDRWTAVTRDESPAMVIRKESEAAPDSYNVAQHRIRFVVEIFTRGSDAEAAADPIEDEVHKKLMADRTLGGVCLLLDAAETEFEGADADGAAHKTIMHFEALYRVAPENLSEAG